MRAYHLTSAGGQARLTDLPDPVPGPGQIGVTIRACGLNFADLLMLKGTYQDTPPLPFTPGMEIAGVIDSLGTGVTGLAPGDRVAIYSGQGGLAQRGVFDAARVVKIPDEMPFEHAAAFQIAYRILGPPTMWRRASTRYCSAHRRTTTNFWQ